MDTRFAQIFIGGDQAHGVQSHREGGTVDHHTADGPATPEDYEAHLRGTRGLGLVPVRKDGTCRFAAIDIDVDTINHAQLYSQLQKLKIPLTVCRSKSGGAHLYLFMKEPGFKASKVISTLKRWSGIIGYPNSEIFPKQVQVSKKNRGNWINLPYFDCGDEGDRSMRYAIGPDGALTIGQFLDGIIYWDGKDEIQTSSSEVLPVLGQKIDMPPCLAYLHANGVPDGHRNQGMFNFAVFLRKAYPNNWQEQVMSYNVNVCKPPLPREELVRIIKSVGGTKYQYNCNEEPILSHCNRQVCIALPFGVGHMPWKENGSLGELMISHLRKVETDPPQFIVEINGYDVTLSNEEFYNFQKLKIRVEDLLDIVVPSMKADRWDAKRHELHASQEIIEAPDDASERGAVMNDVMDFLTQFKNSRAAEDILKGTPIDYNGFICFKASDLQRFLKMNRRQFIDNNALFTLLYENGARFKPARIKGRVIKVWMFPLDKMNIQTEDFAAVKFDKIGEEL